MQPWDIHRDGITQGLLLAWMTCPQKARLSLELRPARVTGALSFGSLVHEALEELYTLYKNDQPYNIVDILTRREQSDRQQLTSVPGHDPEILQQLEESYGVAHALLDAYVNHWTEDFDSKDWIELESEFAIAIEIDNTEYIIRGKRDGIYRQSQRLWLMETKTKGQINEDVIMDKLLFDFQTMLYLWSIWKEYNAVPAGIVYNIIRRPLLRRKKSESLSEFVHRVRDDIIERKDWYFMRYISSIVKNDLIVFEKELKTILRQFIRWSNGEYHYKNSAACDIGGITCNYLPICARNDRSSFVPKERAFTELREIP